MFLYGVQDQYRKRPAWSTTDLGLDAPNVEAEGITARAWRIYIPQRSGDGGGVTTAGYMNLSMGLAATVGGSNICCTADNTPVAGATFNQSSYYSPAGPASSYGAQGGFSDTRANPAASGTFWHSALQSAPWWASIDFGEGSEKTVAEVYIVPVNSNPDARTPYEFYLQISPDGSTWTDVLHVNAITGWALGVEKAWPVVP